MHSGTAHTYRVDPDEPWRYACPECESVQVTANADNDKPNAGPHPYHCRTCWEAFDEPADRKQQGATA